MADPAFSEFEQGERHALLELRKFVSTQGLRLKGAALVREVDVFCATRLHDLRQDAEHRQRA